MTKVQAAINLIIRAQWPMTAVEMARACDCSLSTVYRALDRASLQCEHFWCWQQRSGHFYKVVFPVTWGASQCRKWLRDRCKSGKSKAVLRRRARAPF